MQVGRRGSGAGCSSRPPTYLHSHTHTHTPELTRTHTPEITHTTLIKQNTSLDIYRCKSKLKYESEAFILCHQYYNSQKQDECHQQGEPTAHMPVYRPRWTGFMWVMLWLLHMIRLVTSY